MMNDIYELAKSPETTEKVVDLYYVRGGNEPPHKIDEYAIYAVNAVVDDILKVQFVEDCEGILEHNEAKKLYGCAEQVIEDLINEEDSISVGLKESKSLKESAGAGVDVTLMDPEITKVSDGVYHLTAEDIRIESYDNGMMISDSPYQNDDNRYLVGIIHDDSMPNLETVTFQDETETKTVSFRFGGGYSRQSNFDEFELTLVPSEYYPEEVSWTEHKCIVEVDTDVDYLYDDVMEHNNEEWEDSDHGDFDPDSLEEKTMNNELFEKILRESESPSNWDAHVKASPELRDRRIRAAYEKLSTAQSLLEKLGDEFLDEYMGIRQIIDSLGEKSEVEF